MGVWGRCLHLRRVSRPATSGAGPREFFNRRGEPGLNGIGKNIALNASKLLPATHQMIVTFILPKWLASSAQQVVGLSSTEAFQSAQQSRCVGMRSEEQVHVVGHDHPGVQVAIFLGAEPNRTPYQPRYLRLFKVHRPDASVVKQSVHRHERLPRRQLLLGKLPTHRQTAIQSKSHEQRLSNGIDMWQTAV